MVLYFQSDKLTVCFCQMLNESEGHIRDFRQTEGFMSRGKR